MDFTKTSKILLLGEANFSFALSICSMNICKPEQLLATCFEKKACLTEIAKENSETLVTKGVSVMFNIDGQKLETYFDRPFSTIIFNFPHTGGKMKIQNNRQLLQNFFQSAIKVLSQDGAVFVSLCSGQGGTPLDTTSRKWDDTWQIVPMATYGDFILTHISLFDHRIFDGYKCAGYRSLEKGFNQEGSILYKFSKSNFHLNEINPLHNIVIHMYDESTATVPAYLNTLLQQNIFGEKGSFINFAFNYIIDILRNNFVVNIQDRPIIIHQNELTVKIIKYLSKDKIEINIYPAIVLSSKNYELIPYCVIFGSEVSIVLLQTFINMNFSLNILNTSKSWTPYWKTFNFKLYSKQEKIKILNQEYFVFFINLKKFASSLFDLQNHEMWIRNQNIHLNDDNSIIIYQPVSLFPSVYTFHLSFWVPNKAMSDLQTFHTKVNIIIINTVQDTLVSSSMLGNFNKEDGRMSETYEIVYCSLDKALSKLKVKELHEEVGKNLKLHLGCDIR